MSQRNSGYQRRALDAYETPEWVTIALVPHLPLNIRSVWEPAAGSGKMVAALLKAGFAVTASDVETGRDFLTHPAERPYQGIVTNPPYALASEFIERSLTIWPADGFIAMLLRTDFDHAKSRRCFFRECKFFSKKLVLTKRIQWIDGSNGSPSFNHAWFIWNRCHEGPPTLAYGP